MDYHSIATRGRPSIILTLKLHKLFHVTLDCIAHHPLHWLHTAVSNHTHTHTHTILHPPRSFSNCWVLFSIYHCIAIATLQSHSQLPVSSLALFLVCLPVTWSFPVFSYRLISACPEVYGLFWNDPLPCCFGLCLHLGCTLARLEDSPFASPSGICSPSTDSRISLDTLLSCLNYSCCCCRPMPVLWSRPWIKLLQMIHTPPLLIP